MEIWGGRPHNEAWIKGCVEQAAESQVSSCLNDIENMQQWQGSNHRVRHEGVEKILYHASNGVMGTERTCTLFFVQEGDFNANIVAVGKHTGPRSYRVLFKVESLEVGNEIVL